MVREVQRKGEKRKNEPRHELPGEPMRESHPVFHIPISWETNPVGVLKMI